MVKYILGALDHTNNYIFPVDAIKNKIYKCIDCSENIILKKGSIRKPHF